MRLLPVRRAWGPRKPTRSLARASAVRTLAALGFAAALAGCHHGSPCPPGTKPTGGSISVSSSPDGGAGDGTWLFCNGERGAPSYAVKVANGGIRREQCPGIGTKLEGTYLSWHDNGTLFLRGAYRDGVKQGQWEQWGKEGAQVAAGSYRDGRLVAGAPVGAPAVCEQLQFRP